jgi:hypothetical protein
MQCASRCLLTAQPKHAVQNGEVRSLLIAGTAGGFGSASAAVCHARYMTEPANCRHSRGVEFCIRRCMPCTLSACSPATQTPRSGQLWQTAVSLAAAAVPSGGYALKLNVGAAQVRQLTLVVLRPWAAAAAPSLLKVAYSPATHGLTSTSMRADRGCSRHECTR